jgi:hypothetical protein
MECSGGTSTILAIYSFSLPNMPKFHYAFDELMHCNISQASILPEDRQRWGLKQNVIGRR